MNRDGDRRRRRHDNGNGFDANSIVNLALWLRADTGVTSDGADAVSQWDFKNGTFRGVSNVAQATGVNQPTLVASNASYNNQPTINFDGNDFLDSVAFSSVIAQADTIFIVADADVTASRIYIDTATGANQQQIFSRGGGNADWGIFAGSVLSTGAIIDSNVHIQEYTVNGVNSEIIIDGVSEATGAAGAGDLDSLRVGISSTGTFGLLGDIAEIIIYTDDVSAGDRTILRDYLNERYGL